MNSKQHLSGGLVDGCWPPYLLDAYAGAWNSRFDSVRARLLGRACVPVLEYADQHVRLQGRERLLDYIASVQRNQPGVRWRPDGDVHHRGRSCAIYWVCLRADGLAERGHSFLQLAADGRIEGVVSRWHAT